MENTLKFCQHMLSEGLNTNSDNSRASAGSSFDITNGRIYSVDGKNYVIRNINGNKKYFKISDGYKIIGAKDYNGISYIVSINDSNHVEIGTYPSLAKINYYNTRTFIDENGESVEYKLATIKTTEGLTNSYKPILFLNNTGTDVSKYQFKTNRFGYTQDTRLYPIIKEAYDGTVNIYLCDGVNPNRVVNSGFNANTYEVKHERFLINVSETDYQQNINKSTKQFLSINEPPYAILRSIEKGGNLPVGNLSFYIRYLDYEYNKTNFVPLLGPVAITYGDDIFSVSGNLPSEYDNYTDKKVNFQIRYIDKAYKYFEIAMVWKTGSDPTALATKSKLLSKRFVTNTDNYRSNTIDFSITGEEEYADISYEEVFTPALKETISKSATSLDGRYFGANWKELDYDRDAIETAAKMIFVQPEIKHRDFITGLNGQSIKDFDMNDINKNGSDKIKEKSWYQNSEFVIDRVGYYRGEIYPFALVGILEDGTITDPYPICGIDWLNHDERNIILSKYSDYDFLLNNTEGNNGFVRFPQFGTGFASDLREQDNIDNINSILLAKTRMEYFWSYISSNKDKFKNIKGFYIVRGNRIENLLYHGIWMNTYEGIQNVYDGDNTQLSRNHINPFSRMYPRSVVGDNDNRNTYFTGASFPLPLSYPRFTMYNTALYQISTKKFHPRSTNILGIAGKMSRDITGYSDLSRNRKALYSPDYMIRNINKIKDNDKVYSYIPYVNLPRRKIYYNKYSGASGFVNINKGGIFYESEDSILYNYSSNDIGKISLSKNRYLVRGTYRKNGTSVSNSTLNSEKRPYGYTEITNTDNSIIMFLNNNQIIINDENIVDFINSDGLFKNKNKYISHLATNVEKNIHKAPNKYSSKLGDAVFSDMDPGAKFTPDNDSNCKEEYGNKDMVSHKYLGLDYDDDKDIHNIQLLEPDYLFEFYNDTSMFPVCIYLNPNDEEYYSTIVKRYKTDSIKQLSDINYRIASMFIPISNNRIWQWTNNDNIERDFNNIYPNGDCFIGRFTFRHAFNTVRYEPDVDNISARNYSDYNHGRLFSVIIQSNINIGLRATNSFGFYPIWAKNTGAYESYISIFSAKYGGNDGLDGEDLLYDYGHSETLLGYDIPGINDIYKNRVINHITRVRYTDKHREESFVDGWRNMYYQSKADYPILYGEINAIHTLGGFMAIITNDSLQQIFVNEKAVAMSDQSAGQITIGIGSILSEDSRVMSEYGSQHIDTIQTDYGIYGYDFKRNILWKIELQETRSGMIMSPRPINNNITSFMKNRRDRLSKRYKIVFGYDEKENEVMFTIKDESVMAAPIDRVDNEDGTVTITIDSDVYYNYDVNGYLKTSGTDRLEVVDIYKNTITYKPTSEFFQLIYINRGYTLSYNEKLSSIENDFLTRVGIAPDIYLKLNTDLISCIYNIGKEQTWIHNNNDEKCKFYDYTSWFRYGITSNVSQIENVGPKDYQLIFSNFVVLSDKEPFDNIDYETENQETRSYPFYNEEEFWCLPEFLENKWIFTIPTAKNAINEYDVDSNMRGTWLRTLLVYKGNKEKYIGLIINKNIVSYS